MPTVIRVPSITRALPIILMIRRIHQHWQIDRRVAFRRRMSQIWIEANGFTLRLARSARKASLHPVIISSASVVFQRIV